MSPYVGFVTDPEHTERIRLEGVVKDLSDALTKIQNLSAPIRLDSVAAKRLAKCYNIATAALVALSLSAH